MQVDRMAIAKRVVLALWLLSPLAVGVVLAHAEFGRWAPEGTYWMFFITVVVLWLYGLVQTLLQRDWIDSVVVSLSLPLFYGLLWYGTPFPMSERNHTSPMAFLPLVAVMSLLSAHLYGRRIFCTFAACLMVTALSASCWYDATVLWRLRWMFS